MGEVDEFFIFLSYIRKYVHISRSFYFNMKSMKIEHEFFLMLLPIFVFYFKSVKFYVISDKELNAQNHRISVKAESDSVDISSGCSPTNGLPTAVETIVLVKKGVYSCVSLQIA